MYDSWHWALMTVWGLKIPIVFVRSVFEPKWNISGGSDRQSWLLLALTEGREKIVVSIHPPDWTADSNRFDKDHLSAEQSHVRADFDGPYVSRKLIMNALKQGDKTNATKYDCRTRTKKDGDGRCAGEFQGEGGDTEHRVTEKRSRRHHRAWEHFGKISGK